MIRRAALALAALACLFHVEWAWALNDPRPGGAGGDVGYGSPRDPELARYSRPRHPGAQHQSDLTNIVLAKDREGVARAAVAAPVLNHVGAVLSGRAPPDIMGPIVGRITIAVGDDRPLEWSRPVPRFADQLVDKTEPSLSSEAGGQIPLLVGELAQNNAANAANSGALDNRPTQAAYSPEATDLIMRRTGHGAPFFGIEVGYDLISHVALQKRFGQALARGSNLALVPHSTPSWGGAL